MCAKGSACGCSSGGDGVAGMLLCVLAAGVVAAGVVAFVLAHLWVLVGGVGVTGLPGSPS